MLRQEIEKKNDKKHVGRDFEVSKKDINRERLVGSDASNMGSLLKQRWFRLLSRKFTLKLLVSLMFVRDVFFSIGQPRFHVQI